MMFRFRDEYHPQVKKDLKIIDKSVQLYIASLIATTSVIPAKAGIQKNTGFRVKPGMTNYIRLMSLCIEIKDSHIPKILNDPYIGDELTGDLAGIRSYHLKKDKIQYRISYIIDETQEIVNILMIGKRESFYDILKRRL